MDRGKPRQFVQTEALLLHRQAFSRTIRSMSSVEYCLGNAIVIAAENGFSIREIMGDRTPPTGYDLDLLYVECRFCGSPVLWEKGKTSLLLAASGIDTSLLDAECLILSDGCPQCRSDVSHFTLHVARMSSFTPQDMLLLATHKGHA
jgi:hypothetical protein